MASQVATEISVVIPSLNRGDVVINTVKYLRSLGVLARSIIIVDQTIQHPEDIDKQLEQWHNQDLINWIRLEQPSVVAAMNIGLRATKTRYALFLDDDIKPFTDLIEHYQTYLSHSESSIIAGRVVEPWDDPAGIETNSAEFFSFNGLNNCKSTCFMGGNFLVERDTAIEIGGFDENFKGTAHDYEREFSDRVLAAGNEIIYCAAAGVYHLKVDTGGIRTYGHFLKTAKPHHAVGAYYYILTSKLVKRKPLKILHRLKQRVITRIHLRQPWWIPLTLVGDILGLAWAIKLKMTGPAHIKNVNN